MILLFTASAFSPRRCTAELTLKPEIERLFIDGVQLTFRDQMSEALSKFDSISTLEPEDPIGPFCKAFVYDLFMDEYRSLKFMDEFDREVIHAIELAEKRVKNGNKAAETHLFVGGVYGIRGVRKAMLGDWWGAYKDARKGIKGVRKSVEIDPEIYDAYFGIGSYDYWKSVRMKMLFWLPFVSDDREKGIKELYLSIEKGKFTPLASRTGLLRVFVEEKRYEDCIKLADELMSDYEPDLHARWFKGYSLIKLERWEEAFELYNEIYSLLTAKDFHGPAGKVECWYYLSLCNYHMGNKQEASNLLDKVFSLRDEVNEKIFFYENIFTEAENLRIQIKNN